MAELVAKEPLFKGKNEIDQLGKVKLAPYLLHLFVFSSICCMIYFWVVQ